MKRCETSCGQKNAKAEVTLSGQSSLFAIQLRLPDTDIVPACRAIGKHTPNTGLNSDAT